MFRIIALSVIAIGVIYCIAKLIQSKNRSWRDNAKLIAALAGLVLALLLITGKAHLVTLLLAGLIPFARGSLPLLIKYFPFLQQLWRHRSQPLQHNNNQSSVTATVLKMTLDHVTGMMSGEVLQGQHQGAQLDTLNQTELKDVFEYCLQTDEDSATLLDAYLQRRFGENPFVGGENDSTPNTGSATMTRAEALDILGINDNADANEIRAAHRRLMQKFHPDHGGSDYLAAKINKAKDILLGKA